MATPPKKAPSRRKPPERAPRRSRASAEDREDQALVRAAWAAQGDRPFIELGELKQTLGIWAPEPRDPGGACVEPGEPDKWAVRPAPLRSAAESVALALARPPFDPATLDLPPLPGMTLAQYDAMVRTIERNRRADRESGD